MRKGERLSSTVAGNSSPSNGQFLVKKSREAACSLAVRRVRIPSSPSLTPSNVPMAAFLPAFLPKILVAARLSSAP